MHLICEDESTMQICISRFNGKETTLRRLGGKRLPRGMHFCTRTVRQRYRGDEVRLFDWPNLSIDGLKCQTKCCNHFFGSVIERMTSTCHRIVTNQLHPVPTSVANTDYRMDLFRTGQAGRNGSKRVFSVDVHAWRQGKR